MKAIRVWTVVATFAIFAATASIALAQDGGMPRTTDLATQVSEFEVNGLKVLVKRRPSAQTVTAGLFIRGGARNLTEKTAGIEDLMINVAVEAGKRFSRDVVRRELARTGATIGGSAGRDFSVMSLSSTRQTFDRIWEIFADVAIDPVFNPADFERVREQMLTGLRETETNPDNFLDVLEERYVYAGHPYSIPTEGTPETIGGFKIEEVRNHHRSVMQTSRLMLVFVGDFDVESLKAKVAASFGKLPKGTYTEPEMPALDFSKPSLNVIERELPTNYIKGVFEAPAPGSPDYYPMRVAISLLQSRVYQEVRVKRQLSYAPNAEIGSSAANTANIYVTAVDANQAVSVMLQEINNLKTRLVANDEITGVSGYFLTTYYLGEETNAAQGGSLARYQLIGKGWRQSYEFLDKIREVKDTDIRRVAQRYMKNIRFVVIGNSAAINRKVFVGQ